MKKIVYVIIIITLESCFGPDIIMYRKIYIKNETLQNLNIKFFTSTGKYFSLNLLSNSMDSMQLKEVTRSGDPPRRFTYLQHKDNLDLEIGLVVGESLSIIDSLEIQFNSNKKIGFNIDPRINFNLLEGIQKTDSFFYKIFPPNIDSLTIDNRAFGSFFYGCCYTRLIIILRPSLYDSAR